MIQNPTNELKENNAAFKTFKRKRDKSQKESTSSLRTSPEPTSDTQIPILSPQPLQKHFKPSPTSKTPFRKKSFQQTHLDLGQKNFFSVRCPTCGLVYTPGKEQDDKLHATYHKSPAPLKYSSSKTDVVVSTDGAIGSIVLFRPTNNPPKLIKELSLLLENELGLLPGWLLAVPCSIFLYVCSTTRNVLACLFAEPIYKAWTATSTVSNCTCTAPSDFNEKNNETLALSKVDGGRKNNNNSNNNSNSNGGVDHSITKTATIPISSVPSNTGKGVVMADTSTQVKARYGIRIMWTAIKERRKGLSTKILDCARSQLTRGYVLSRKEVAFSQPTPEGAAFIQNYVEDETFLVYNALQTLCSSDLPSKKS